MGGSSLIETYVRRLWVLLSDPRRVGEFVAGKLRRLRQILGSENPKLAAWLVLEVLLGTELLFSYLNRYFVREVFGNSMILDLSYEGISRALFFEGVREPNAAEAFRRGVEELLRETDEEIVFLDIGANIGYYTLQVASLTEGRGTTYAIEPHPDNRSLLEANVSLNGFQDDVVVVGSAIGARDGTGTLSLSTHSNHHSMLESMDYKYRNTGESLEVPIQRVSTFLRDNDIPARSVNVVRMDVDGYESEVFRGMEDVIRSNTPLLLFVEVHPDRMDTEYVVEMLRDGAFELLSASDVNCEPVDLSSFDDVAQYDNLKLVLKRGW